MKSWLTILFFCYTQALAALVESGSIGDLIWIDGNNNGIQDDHEVGAAGVRVNLYSVDGKYLRTVVSDPSGFYEFVLISPGKYFIEVLPPSGYELTSWKRGNNKNVDSDVNPITSLSSTIDLENDEVESSIDCGLFRSGEIGNLVWEDNNRDGIQDANEPGLAGIEINLFDAQTNRITTTFSDELGLYAFKDLAPGSYIVEFLAEEPFILTVNNAGFEHKRDSDPDPIDNRVAVSLPFGKHDLSVDAGWTRPETDTSILLETEQVLSEEDQAEEVVVEFVEEKLAPEKTTDLVEKPDEPDEPDIPVRGCIGDVVWLDFSGDGQRSFSEPGLQNYQITLQWLDSNGKQQRAIRHTDTFGHYNFCELECGLTYTVTVEAISTTATKLRVTTEPQITVDLDCKQDYFEADFGFHDENLSGLAISGQIWNDFNSDGFYNAEEEGLSSVSVELWEDGTLVAKQLSGWLGYFSFTGLKEGKYQVVVSDTGNVLVGYNLTTERESYDLNLVKSYQQPYINFGFCRKEAASAIFGSVWRDENGSQEREPDELGVPNVIVQLLDNTKNKIAEVSTDARGRFIFENLIIGEYILKLHESSTEENITLDENEPHKRVSLMYTTGLPEKPQMVIGDSVWFDANENEIVDYDEKGLSQVGLLLRSISNNSVLATQVTDTAGNYLFTNIVPGSYSIELLLNTLPVNYRCLSETSVVVQIDKEESYLLADFGCAPLRGVIGGSIWVDANGNGTSDEDLTIFGLNQVEVLLHKDGKQIAKTQTRTINGIRGQYKFTELPYAKYLVEIVLASVPSAVSWPTSDLEIKVDLRQQGEFLDASCGFYRYVKSIRFEYLRAVKNEKGVVVQWKTEKGVRNIGFNVYRSETKKGQLIKLNKKIIEPHITDKELAYELLTEGKGIETNFFWLEDVGWESEPTMHGPMTIDQNNQTGSFQSVASAPGIYELDLDALILAGLQVDSRDIGHLQVKVDGIKVASFLSSLHGPMKQDDFVLFYVSHSNATVEVYFSATEGKRMQEIYVGNLAEEVEDSWRGVAEMNGLLEFEATSKYTSYLLAGFRNTPVWILDVTKNTEPKLLFGSVENPAEKGLGMHVRYIVSQPALCIAMDLKGVKKLSSDMLEKLSE